MAKKKEQHPTLFIFNGSIQWYQEGSMLELHAQITEEEWRIIVSDTIKYKVFADCLKDVACPILEDSWTDEDEWFRLQMEIAVSRIRNIDPLLVAKFDQGQIRAEYTKQIQQNSVIVKKEIEIYKKEQLRLNVGLSNGNGKSTKVSDL